jgi:hypothetical protein
MEKSSVEKDRFFTVIKLLPDNEEVRKMALQHVESKLEFSLSDPSLLSDTSDPYNEILLSEIAKCLIISDVCAKIQYQEEKFQGRLKFSNAPPIHLLRYGDLPRFLEVYKCPMLIQRYLELMKQYSTFMDENVIMHRTIAKEDILVLAIITMNNPADKKDMYAACLMSKLYGFMGMIYLYNACYTNSIYVDIIREKYDVVREEKEAKTLCMYGIRSTLFAVDNKQKGVARDLISSIASYSRLIKFPLLCVVKPPIGIMSKLLMKLGFSSSYHAASSVFPKNDEVNIILDLRALNYEYDSVLNEKECLSTHNNLL